MTQGEGKKILDFYYTHKRMPSYREIADLMGYASKNAAFSLVTKLIDAGFIQKDHTGKLIPTHLFSEVKLLGAVEAGFPSVAEEQLIDTMSIDDFLIEHRDASYVSLHTMRTTLFCIVMFVLAPWVAGASSYLSDTPPSVKDTIATHIDSFFTSLFSFSPKETYTKVGESFTKGVDTTLTNIPQALGVAIDSTTGELIYLLAQENTTQLGAASLSETAVSFFCFVNNTLGLNTCKEEETPVTPTPTPTTFVPVEERIKETTPPTPSTSAGQVPQKKTSSAPTPLPPQAPTRVVERVVTPEYITIEANNTDLLSRISFLESSLALLTTKLNTLPTQTATTFTGYGTYSSYQPPSTPVWGLTQKIDNLSVGVQIPSAVITNPTITGGSLSSVTLNNPTIVGYTATGTSTLSVLSGTTTLATQSPSSVLFTNASKQIATTPLFSFTGSNLGIGTTTPWSTLSVSGDASVTGSLFLASSTPLATTNRLYNNASSLYWNGALVAGATVGNWTLSGGNVYRATGNVGVGTTSPASKLYVTSDYQNAAFTPTGSKNKGIALDTGLAAGNGTYAHLGLTFNMDAGANQFSGIYGIHNNSSQTELAFVTTGTEKVRIDTNGNVGIGTTAPNQKLEVSGNALVTGYLRVGANSGGSGVAGDIVARRSSNTGAYYFGDSSSNYLYFDGTNYQFGNAGLYVKTDGNVGIGTSAPQEKLQIFKDGTPAEGSFGLSILSASLDSELALGASASGDYSYIQSFSDGVSWTNRPLTLQPNGGNVGIGTTAPGNLLTINQAANTTDGTNASYGFMLRNQTVDNLSFGSDASYNYIQSWASKPLKINSQGNNTLLNPTSGNVGIGTTGPIHKLGFGYDASGEYISFDGVGYVPYVGLGYDPTADGLVFRRNYGGADLNTDDMFISRNTGNVGIGTTSPWSYADTDNLTIGTASGSNGVTIAGATRSNIFFSDGASQYAGIISYLHSTDSLQITTGGDGYGSVRGININSSGNVGIGTTSPWKKLSVEGGVAINGLTAAAGTPSALCLSASKEMVVNTGTSNCTVSSAQFKHDIETLTTEEAKRIVLGIEPVSFKYNGTNEPRLGFIAEQIETIEPRLVARDTDGSPRSVHYAEITAVLSAVVKEHQSNFDLLQSGSEPSWFVESVRRVLSQVTELTINIFTANVVYVKERLCIGDTCITESDLQELLLLREEGSQNGSTGDDSGGTEQDDTPEELPADTTAPIIIMQGNNPALLTVGESYADLGAVATDDSGIATLRTYYLGTEVTAVQIDTTQVMEHIITYVARDLTGNTATSTRTVIVSAGEGADEGPAEAPQP